MFMTLQIGSKGSDVKAWQEFLNSRNIAVDVDSDFGKATEKATRLWQQRAGIDQDGVVGNNTLKKAVELGFKGFTSKAAVIEKKPVVTPSESHTNIFKGDDSVTQKSKAMLSRVHPTLQARVLAFLEHAKADGVTLQVVQGLRTFAEQDALYAKGRTKPGPKVTNAPAGKSNHNYGTAVDIAPIINGKISWDEKHFKAFGKWAEKARLSWGGNWKSFTDLPHLELPGLPKIATMLMWYKAGGLSAVWDNVE